MICATLDGDSTVQSNAVNTEGVQGVRETKAG